jgi:adenylate kinase
MTRLLIVGPPGAGKGTQAKQISAAFGIPTISTGDIFRFNIANQTELGVKVKAIVDGGDYVPAERTNALGRDRLGARVAADGFLLDGYPRTTEQVRYLDAFLAGHGVALDAVIRLVADRDAIVERLRKRAVAEGRVDDSEEAIRHRQDVYLRETDPLITVYRTRGLHIEVDGLGSVDDVAARISRALAERGIGPAENDRAVG